MFPDRPPSLVVPFYLDILILTGLFRVLAGFVKTKGTLVLSNVPQISSTFVALTLKL